jgi:glycosyltransferase involved in cell wall biosynthesis
LPPARPLRYNPTLLELSIVIPFLNERQVLPALRQRFDALADLPAETELVFVSDGSVDGSIEIIEQWAAERAAVKLVILTRNFGHQAAISAGLSYAAGDYVAIMDADLQDPPEVMLELYRTATSQRCDIVYSIRQRRQVSFGKRVFYNAFYRLYGLFAETPVNLDSGDFCVMNRKAVNGLLRLPEKVRFVRGLRSWLGLREIGVPTERPDRQAGRPQYSMLKLIGLAVDGLTSFSVRPLRISMAVGALMCVASLAAALVYLWLRLFTNRMQTVPGFTTIALLILFSNGLTFLMLGILGEYIGKIFWEVKDRPTFIVDRTVNLQ